LKGDLLFKLESQPLLATASVCFRNLSEARDQLGFASPIIKKLFGSSLLTEALNVQDNMAREASCGTVSSARQPSPRSLNSIFYRPMPTSSATIKGFEAMRMIRRPAGLNSESSSACAENKSSILRVPASNHFGFA